MRFRALLVSAVLLPLAAQASPQDLIVGIDEKAVWGPEGLPVNGAGGHDTLAVVDIADPLHPAIRATLPLENSVFGPPTNLQITPNGRLALVADSVTNMQAEGKWTATPTDKLFVVDLDATPPALVDTVSVGRQPSGLAINAQEARSQDQLHIHVDCLKPDVRDALRSLPAASGWIVLPSPLHDQRYRALRLPGSGLTADPFRLLAGTLPDGTGLGGWTLVVAQPDEGGMVLLAGQAGADGPGHGEDLLDHGCALARHP